MNAAQLTALDTPGVAARAPLAWIKADTLPNAFRACWLCAHGADEGSERVCQHPALLHMTAALPVAIVRAWGGGCGPDADKHTPKVTA